MATCCVLSTVNPVDLAAKSDSKSNNSVVDHSDAVERTGIRPRHAVTGVVIPPSFGMAQIQQPIFSGSAVLWPDLLQVGASRPLVRHHDAVQQHI